MLIVSYAIGDRVKADAFGTFAIGYNGTSDINASKEVFSYSNRAFVIGNGGVEGAMGYSDPSDAVTILFDGSTTIAGNVTAPTFIGDGSQLTNLSFSNLNNAPLSFGTSPSFPGVESATNEASGPRSFSVGHVNTSSGDYSTTFGGGNSATSGYSLAAGQMSNATGTLSTAIGQAPSKWCLL